MFVSWQGTEVTILKTWDWYTNVKELQKHSNHNCVHKLRLAIRREFIILEELNYKYYSFSSLMALASLP